MGNYYTQEFDDNLEINGRHYCESCGHIKEAIEDKIEVTASEAVLRLAYLYEDKPILAEIILARLAHPDMSLLNIAKQIGRDKNTVTKYVKQAGKDMIDITRYLLGTYYTNYAIKQTERRKIEKEQKEKSQQVNNKSTKKLEQGKQDKQSINDIGWMQ